MGPEVIVTTQSVGQVNGYSIVSRTVSVGGALVSVGFAVYVGTVMIQGGFASSEEACEFAERLPAVNDSEGIEHGDEEVDRPSGA